MALSASLHTSLSQPKMADTWSLLDRCSNMEELKQIHSQMIKADLVADAVPMSRLLVFCASPNSGDLAYAEMLFERFERPNTLMWNTMIRGYSNSYEPERALPLYHQMLHHSVPFNAFTFPFLLKACSTLSALEIIQQMHAHIIKFGFGSEVYATNSLVHGYAMAGSIKSAHLLFGRLPHRDIVTYNTMINGCKRCGDIELADEIFKEMPEKNVVSWTTMISSYVEAGQYKKSLNLFQEMQTVGVEPDDVSLTCILSACAHLGALDQGKWIHAYIDRTVIQIDPIIGCALIDMYARCGDVEEALAVFLKMERKNVAAWTALISGLAINGKARDALYWFMKMQKAGIMPNQITFTAILKACSYAGLVDKGKSLFQSMEKSYGLKPTIEHYGCMVDLLGRAGMLTEAKKLVETMPMKPNAVIWGALLSACRIHGNKELGKQIGKTLIEVDPDHGGRYIQLASIHAAAGEWNQAVEVRKKMKVRGLAKLPGCSAISINGIVHEFFAGDNSHPDMKEIYHEWNQIAERLREEGYKPATGSLLHDLEDEDKETAIHHHSEKLAMAFGLRRMKPGTTLRIVKNLRICEDCHTVARLISKIYDKEMIMRDRIRFHHFRDGKCTCGDYW
ncbi:pentatricopeptide repeat-containing protein At5g66520 [Tripterygium wilfordii]|uniref:pentatricopeptide repeat-containing protein At5g66520 n=1 Tax=Tripterygium wilfordii TaxID=458696 RepID=UPI0018F83CD4|nr:pentatricopeptide repeat-containing protein At5g66520 [Tripterygium wilfordii]